MTQQVSRSTSLQPVKKTSDLIRSLDSMIKTARVERKEGDSALALRAAAW